MKKITQLLMLNLFMLQITNAQDNVFNATGNVGIGDKLPAGAKLVISSTGVEPQVRVFQQDGGDFARIRMVNKSGLDIGGPATNGRYWDIAAYIDKGQVEEFDQLSFWNQRTGSILNIRGNGNVGIKNSNPTAPLSFATELGKKISLYHGNTGDVGISVQGNALQLYVDDANGQVQLGYDDRGIFQERFAIKRTGALAIAGNTGNAGQVLTSNGNGAAAQWKSGTNAIFQNSVSLTPPTTTPFTILKNAVVAVPGLSDAFRLTDSAKVLVNYQLLWNGAGCLLCADPSAFVDVMFDGVSVSGITIDAVATKLSSASGSVLIPAGPGTHSLSIRISNGATQDILVRGQVRGGTNMSRIILPK